MHPSKHSSTARGAAAEQAAAEWLARQGFRLYRRNWRARGGEIDIIAGRHGVFHLVEVRYRRTGRSGNGLDSIDAAKRRHLVRSARLWQHHERIAAPFVISAISLSGEPPAVDAFVESVM